MTDFSVRTDSVSVEQLMEQIRQRIREKRGVDYTEQQIQELAAVKLEKMLDPRGVRSDLLEQFRRVKPPYTPPDLPNYAFEEHTLYESHRSALRWVRRLLNPLLKLLFNPNPLIQALNIQSRLNTMNAEREARRESARQAADQLYYELLHNLVVETTRTAIEVTNLKMRVESLTSRLEFNERRARALEGVVLYKPEPAERGPEQPAAPRAEPSPAGTGGDAPSGTQGAAEGPGQRSRRRRRRRGRRGGASAVSVMEGRGDAPPGGAPPLSNAGTGDSARQRPDVPAPSGHGGVDAPPTPPLADAPSPPASPPATAASDPDTQ